MVLVLKKGATKKILRLLKKLSISKSHPQVLMPKNIMERYLSKKIY
jgi:hypothetical protein